MLVTRNQFLQQEINSCHKKSFLVNSHPLVKLVYQFATMRESYQIIRLSFIHLLGAWFPGSQGICRPGSVSVPPFHLII